MKQLSEAELVEAARNGNVESFGELYRRHYVTVVGMAYCVVADRHLAEDAAQEAFVVACRELARLRSSERFVSWICTIVKRIALRMAQTGRNCRSLERTPVAAETDSGPPEIALVRQAVIDLPKSAREVVVLHYFSRLTHKEIATSLGLSQEAVHGRLVRARRILAERLRGNGLGDIEQ